MPTALSRLAPVLLAAALASSTVLTGVAAAEPPPNDDFDTARVVTALPFTATVDTGAVTAAPDDPQGCGYFAGSAWFAFTATEDGFLRAATTGVPEAAVSAYTGTRGALTRVDDGCATGRAPTITFRAEAGATYHFMVTDHYSPGGPAPFTLTAVPVPANDAFAGAAPLDLPSTREVDLTTASTEYDEPGERCGPGVRRSVWFSHTATESAVLRVATSNYDTAVAVYTGSVLPELATAGCARGGFGDNLTFPSVAGTTYHVRVSTYYAQATTLTLAVAPPLRPAIHATESPSSYELTTLHGDSGEWGVPIVSGQWDFGDGTAPVPAGSGSVSHHYTADGTYEVRLTATTADGRTGTATRTVAVSTHDVSITKLVTPAKARTGETKSITVHVGNTRYRETATVTLSKSDGTGWEVVGTLTLDVPARPDRSVKFPFAYTFTAADAVVGKVTFHASVGLPYGVRDARPFDNQHTSLGTTVLPSLADLRHA